MIPLVLRRDRQRQRRRDIALQGRRGRMAGGAGREPRGIEGHVHLLRPLDLEHLGHQTAALGGRLPVDLLETVAGDVFTKLLELPPLPQLPMRMRSGLAAAQKDGGHGAPLGPQIRVDPDLRDALDVATFDPERPPAPRPAWPREPDHRGALRQLHGDFGVGRLDARGEGQADPHAEGPSLRVAQVHVERPLAVADQADDRRQNGRQPRQAPRRPCRIDQDQDDEQPRDRRDACFSLGAGGAEDREGQSRRSDPEQEASPRHDHRGTGTSARIRSTTS